MGVSTQVTSKLRTRIGIGLVVAAIIAALALTACGDASQEVAPRSSPIDPATPRPADTAMPAATARPAAAPAPAPTAQPALPAPTPLPTSTPLPGPTSATYPDAPGIVDPSNLGWPREVETSEGVLRLDGPPQRIHTLSLGHDEIIAALIGPGRFSGIGSFTANPTYSNIASEVGGLKKVKRDAEEVLGLDPDLVIASKFSKADLVDLIKAAGVPVARTALESSTSGNIPNILLLGYMLGAEDRALALIADINGRIAVVTEHVPQPGDPSRPAVLAIARFSDTISAAGGGSTEGGIIEAGGGVNAAARDGIDGHQPISVESIAAMNPDVILITQPEPGAGVLREELLAEPALALVPAITLGRIVISDPKHYTTLSHWNVRGIEETAKLLYPDRFRGVKFADFEPYPGR